MSKDIYDFSDLNELAGSTKGAENVRKYEEAHKGETGIPDVLMPYIKNLKIRQVSDGEKHSSLTFGVKTVKSDIVGRT